MININSIVICVKQLYYDYYDYDDWCNYTASWKCWQIIQTKEITLKRITQLIKACLLKADQNQSVYNYNCNGSQQCYQKHLNSRKPTFPFGKTISTDLKGENIN